MTTSTDRKSGNRFWVWILVSFLAGMFSLVGAGALIYWGANTFDEGNRFPERPAVSVSELMAERRAMEKKAILDKQKSTKALVDRMYRRQLKDPDCTMDFLILSGGGENGAFGAGVLVGWSGLSAADAALPEFDGVTGVSAGSFIAPFAYLGTPESLQEIDHFFRNPSKDWLELRGPLYFLPENMSLGQVAGLKRDLKKVLSESFAKKIEEATTPGRLLLIQASNLDEAFPRVFDFVEASRKALATGDFNEIVEILLASSAIPGMFPPREIDGALYVDGGVEGNFYAGGKPSKPEDTFGGVWKKEHPDRPIPKTRYWIILNGNLREAPVMSTPDWADIALRSLAVSVGSSEVVALRELYALAELTRLRGDGEVEVRWIAIEESVPTSVFPDIFEESQMRALSDLGRRIGADPNSWNTESP